MKIIFKVEVDSLEQDQAVEMGMASLYNLLKEIGANSNRGIRPRTMGSVKQQALGPNNEVLEARIVWAIDDEIQVPAHEAAARLELVK